MSNDDRDRLDRRLRTIARATYDGPYDDFDSMGDDQLFVVYQSFVLRCSTAERERDEARGARDQFRAEVEMLRGVGCNEDGDGPCGACLKCYKAKAEQYKEARDVWLGALSKEQDRCTDMARQAVEAEDEAARLRAAIEGAPHAHECPANNSVRKSCEPWPDCTCWKSAALSKGTEP